MAAKNLIELFETTCQRYMTRTAYQFKKSKKWQDVSWEEMRQKVKSLSAALQDQGVTKGDRVAILANTRPEWTLADLGIISLGAITVPIYQSNLAEEVAYILHDSEAKGVFVEDEAQMKKVQQIRDQVPTLEFIVVIEGRLAKSDAVAFNELLETDPDLATVYDGNAEQLDGDTIASFVYTSGTTGKPKGAILTHGNFIAEATACVDIINADHRAIMMGFLPLAHILGRAVQFYHLATGFTCAYAESIERLGENILEVRPHFFVCVPRIFEKVYERILSQVHSASAVKQKLFAWAVQVGREYSQAKQRGESPSIAVSGRYFLAKKLVFKKIAARLGGRMVFAVCGGAPLAKEIAEFFHAVGIMILEGYGLTETTAAINCVRIENIEFGSVGPPVHQVEEKIADDGEILVRGPVVFKGYYKNEVATKEVLDEEGWFHTGDIGEFTSDGSLRITDRKKDIIVTAGGKNIAPQKIEGLLKLSKYISQVVVHGDKQKYLTALITLSPEEIDQFVKSRKLKVNGSEIAKHPKVYEMIKQVVDENNKKLPSYETIKRFAILEHELTQEAGEVTPSLKVKRRFVVEKYADIFNRLYQESAK